MLFIPATCGYPRTAALHTLFGGTFGNTCSLDFGTTVLYTLRTPAGTTEYLSVSLSTTMMPAPVGEDSGLSRAALGRRALNPIKVVPATTVLRLDTVQGNRILHLTFPLLTFPLSVLHPLSVLQPQLCTALCTIFAPFARCSPSDQDHLRRSASHGN